MPEPFVLDASVSTAWFLAERERERRAYAEHVLEILGAGLHAFVPELWHYEAASVLVKAYRDGGLNRKRLEAARDLIRRLHLFTVRLRLPAVEVLNLA